MITLRGLYEYDNTLFDEFCMPTVFDSTDPDCIDTDAFSAICFNLMFETLDQEVLYPDSEIMKNMIGAWSYSRLHAWNAMAKVLYEDYDPFVNIKRDETRTIQTYGTNTEKVSAWDSATFENRGENSGNSYVTENFHVEGDSAITDAQDVARKEMEVRKKYDLYRIIIDEFRDRFCLAVY